MVKDHDNHDPGVFLWSRTQPHYSSGPALPSRGAPGGAAADAASTAEKILYGAAAMVFISSYYSKMDDESQLQLLDQCQQETGVYDSAEADNRVQTVYQNLKDTGHVLRDYKVYVSPSEDINAFASLGGVLCVNKGTLDQMDDDELAYVMAHEIRSRREVSTA